MVNIEVLENKLREGNISFYGYRGGVLEFNKDSGFLNFYVLRKNKTHQKLYQTYRDIYESKADIVFIDNEAIRNLLLGFPLNSEIVLVRLRLTFDWFYGLMGLTRRLLTKQVTIRGTHKTRADGVTARWLILENHLPVITKNNLLATPNSVDDVEKLIKYLNDHQVQYVVLRNFEYLPKLHREHGDIDFLVADSDFVKVREFLKKNPGQQSIGVHLVSTPKSKIEQVPYLPPKKAKSIIQNAIVGRCDSKIPNPLDAFQSYAYHCVYNKGVACGLPSSYADLPINKVLENDYLATLERLAKAAGVENIEFTMEELDQYLYSAGWRPHMDTLLKLADKNVWINKHFFSGIAGNEDPPFVAIVLRKENMKEELKQNILSLIDEYGFRVIFDEKLQGEKKVLAEGSLRGGVWVGRHETHSAEFLPSDFLVVTDLYTLHKKKTLFAHRVRLLKLKIREMLQSQGYSSSIIHSTDNTDEAKEYIKTVYPESLDEIIASVNKCIDENISVHVSLADQLELFKYDILDRKAALKKNVRVKVVNFVFQNQINKPGVRVSKN